MAATADLEARFMARALRRMFDTAGQYASAAGAVELRRVGDAIEYLASLADAAQGNWSDLNGRGLTNGQLRNALTPYFADVTLTFPARLSAVRTALTAVEQSYVDDLQATDRTWSVAGHVWTYPTVTKAARVNLDSRLADLRTALAALA